MALYFFPAKAAVENVLLHMAGPPARVASEIERVKVASERVIGG